jgi:hypothetical protein
LVLQYFFGNDAVGIYDLRFQRYDVRLERNLRRKDKRINDQ